MKKRRSAFLLALPTLVALLACFVFPMVYVLVKTVKEDGLQDFINFFTDEYYLKILWTTVRISLISTAVSLLLGYPMAYYMARTRSKMRNVMMVVILFPFLVSAVVRAFGWMVVLGKQGLINKLLTNLGIIEKPLKMLYTEGSVVVGMIHLLIPYMVLSLIGVLQSIDPNVEYAAYSLGATPAKVFTKVIFPLSVPGIISGCVLVFTMSMTSYVTPKLMGGQKFSMMATMVVQEINVRFNLGNAAALSYVLFFSILLMQLIITLSTGKYMKRFGGGKNA